MMTTQRAYEMGWRDGLTEAADILRDIIAMREAEEGDLMGWEWRDRERHLDGKYARRKGREEYSHFHLVLPRRTAELLRKFAPLMGMEYGQLVARSIDAFFEENSAVTCTYGGENGPDFEPGNEPPEGGDAA